MGTVNHMDLDAITAARRGEWERLAELAADRGLRGADVDELVERYRSASADLADIKTSAGRTPTGDHVSTILGRARLRLTGAGDDPLRQIPRFFALQLPAALYRVRWTTLVIALAYIGIGSLTAVWMLGEPASIATIGPPGYLKDLAEHQFTDYYSENPVAEFAGLVWTNNAWLAAQAVIFGITGIWPLMMMMGEAIRIGQMAALMFSFDRGDVFFASILPHGLLELTSIFVAAAAGLQIFWSWVAPGRRTRGEALAAAGRSLATIVIGLILSLALSGVIEGFITRQPWPVWIKVGIGAAALALFLFYMLFVGRRAHRAGETGDLTEYEAGTPRLVAG